MKTNLFSKVAVTMMTVALGAGVVGSISGTVAWFQYSTRSTVAYTGASAHCTENLQIRLYDPNKTDEQNPWKSDLEAGDITNALRGISAKYKAPTADAVDAEVSVDDFYGQFPSGGEYKFVCKVENEVKKWYLNGAEVNLATYGITAPGTAADGGYIRVIANATNAVRPVTSGELAAGKIATELYRNPVYQYPDKGNWKTAEASDYVVVPLELRVKDVNGADNVRTLAKNIYVSRMNMAVEETPNKGDITPALRAAISTSNDGSDWDDYGTFSSTGSPVTTYGKLDLNDDSNLDTYGDFEWEKGPEILYGYKHSPVTVNKSSTNIVSVTVDGDWFVGANGVAAGSYEFTYEDGNGTWNLGENNPVDIATYGIRYTLDENKTAPGNGDRITVTVAPEAAGNNAAASFGLTPVTEAADGIADDSDPYNIIGTPIGVTTENATLRVNLKIYLEGWQELGGSALWDAKTFIGAKFNLGVRFTADAHTDH